MFQTSANQACGERARMKIISFAWTTPALLAGRKTRTRRDWADRHAKTFHIGDRIQAWNHVPRVKGAVKVGEIVITGVRRERYCDVKAEDWEKEGFAYLTENGLPLGDTTPGELFTDWALDDSSVWVIDFKLAGEPSPKAQSPTAPLHPLQRGSEN